MSSITGSSAATDRESPQVLVLAGTTAVGKTDVSIPLAESLKGEVVSADSRQIYRELNIGTAKPSAEQLRRVPHHFVNEKSIRERWTAGDFARAARWRIEEILDRGHVPVVVGGSMLYLRALLEGFYPSDDEMDTDYLTLRDELSVRGADDLYRELNELDPELAARIHPRDHHRLLRGLAVGRRRKRPLSELQREPRQPIAHPYRLFFLYADRQWTYERVNLRVSQMIASGLVDEVMELRASGFTPGNCRALQTHGYQEVYPYLEGVVGLEQMVENIRKAVRHYVKRQLTWFRRVPHAIWVERGTCELAEQTASRLELMWRRD